jgi:cytochrome c biogenesis protein CcmG/thiol:disulfide interchange protein DsbE
VTEPQPRHGLIGPFTGRQLLVMALALAAVAAVIAFATAPIQAPTPTQPPVGASFVPVASPTAGLQPGDQAPELSALITRDSPLHTAGWIVLAGAGALVLLGLGLASRFRRSLVLCAFSVVVALVSLPLLLAPNPAPERVGLVDLQGRPVRLADFRGRPVWIDFWASWCPPCQEETPTLEAAYRAHRDDGLVLLAISVQETSPQDVKAYARTYGISYPIGFDATSAIFKAYQAYGLPTQIFINRAGIVSSVYRGPVSAALAEVLLKPILAPLPPG